LKSIVAFANTAGGILLIGVEDRSRNLRGVADPLDEEERLAHLISDRISPRFVPEVEILPWRQTQVLALPQACVCGWAPASAALWRPSGSWAITKGRRSCRPRAARSSSAMTVRGIQGMTAVC
jgi:hypothetical protein